MAHQHTNRLFREDELFSLPRRARREKVLLLSDSMTRDIPLDPKIHVRPFGGATVQRLNQLVTSGQVPVDQYTLILVHVGTNDIEGRRDRRTGVVQQETVQQIHQQMLQLRSKICSLSSASVFLVSILPRPRDHHIEAQKQRVDILNSLLKESLGTGLVKMSRRFQREGAPKAELFLKNHPVFGYPDYLHLSKEGKKMYARGIINVIANYKNL